jgi:non-specific protein-tyrosine kinase
MKLRKALDKAKKTRQKSEPSRIKRKPVVVKENNNQGWVAPEYSDSVQAKLDPQFVRDNRFVCIDQEAPELDFYKVLRTKIQLATRSKGWNTIMITSPQAGEGKTTTSVNLALTFAKAFNQTLLLVDCDLRRQNIHNVLGIESTAGLVDYLVNQKPLSDFIIWPGIKKMTVISGGRTIQNSAELLGSERMKTLVEEMKSRYPDRYILFDSPPVLLGADTLALAPLVDCIVMVVFEGKTTMRQVKKAVAMLPQDKLIGFVMNRQRKGKGSKYGYYYKY